MNRFLVYLATGPAKERLDKLSEQGFDLSRKSHWDMDHILPVVEGGGQTGLENLRTLCQPCHKKETRELAARRARARKEDSNQEVLPL